jgi:hypothetical protein
MPVTIEGSLFVADGSTTVSFGDTPAQILTIDAPNAITAVLPPGTPGSAVDVIVECSNGTGILADGFFYESLSVIDIAPVAGNILGGTVVTIGIDLPTTVEDTTVTFGEQPATILRIDADSIDVASPGVIESTGSPVDVFVSNSNGSGTLRSAYEYTPVLRATVLGNVLAGALEVDWVTDPAAAPGQVAWLWLGSPSEPLPPAGVSAVGIAGRLHQVPLLFVFTGFPTAFAPVTLGFGPLPLAIADVPLHLQSMVTGEGLAKGSFTNVVHFTIPATAP